MTFPQLVTPECFNRALVDGRLTESEMRVLPLDERLLERLEELGFHRAVISKARYAKLKEDVLTLDFSGFRMPSLLRFVPPSRQGRKKSSGKKKVPCLWTACVATRRKDLSIFPYIPPPSVFARTWLSTIIYPWEAPIDEAGQLLHSSL